ncbi:MAG: carbohydrate binding family 9 domain-containing protein, partial [Gemmatimonadetes bacterium]|nr:carbohydrate binding family 9 domain-containing protein [Gemmatimonadota bacterium]
MSIARRLVTLALATVALTTGLDAQVRTYHGRNRQTVAELPRLDEAPTIDGVLDDAVWSRAVLLTGFSAYLPLDDRPAADSTDVLVYYSSSHVYFAVRAFETHGAVHATLAARDKIDMDDYIQILLDPFNDRRRAFVFGINPLGAQADGVRTEGFNPPQPRGQTFGGNPPAFIDLSPDLVFESKGRLTDAGYEIEVAIPLKSIRFQGSNTQQWAVQVLRFVQHSGYQQTWTPARRGAASFLVQSGTLTGLHDLRREAVIELNPELTESYNGAYPSGSTDFAYTSTPNVGGNVRWRIVPNLTFNATVRPDFSQVEADAAQVPGDTRFALFFPERRPFFIDGIEQFDAP